MKFETRDGKTITIKMDRDNEELVDILANTIPRLTYDEILDGELERKLSSYDLGEVKLSSNDDINQLIFSLAMFNSISKPTGF